MIKIEKHEEFVDGKSIKITYHLLKNKYGITEWELDSEDLEQLREAINNIPKEELDTPDQKA